MIQVLMALMWIVFTLSAVFLGLIILIQEGKGGGLAEAFGGLGQETFGVGARGVNKVTAILATVFLMSAIMINKCAFQGANVDLPGKARSDNSAPQNPGNTPPRGQSAPEDSNK